jgi:hypothetical protein
MYVIDKCDGGSRFGPVPYVNPMSCVISSFRRGVDEVFAVLGCYAVYAGCLPTFRDGLSVPSSTVKQSNCLTVEDGTH